MWGRISGSPDPALQRRYDQAMQRLMEALWDGPWLMGDRFTAVDVMVGASLGWGRQHLPESPLFDLYLERLGQRPAAVRARGRDGEIHASQAA